MNESPAPVVPEAPVVTAPAPEPQQPIQGSQKLSTWALILGIASVVLAIVLFISIPAAIVAIILGAMALAKHRPGKTKALIGLIAGAAALVLFIPASIGLIVVLSGQISEKALLEAVIRPEKDLSSQEPSKTSNSNSASVVGDKVVTDCYTYTIPKDYEFNESSKDCTTAVNIADGDTLTRVVVKPNTGKIGTLQDAVDTLNVALKKADPKTEGVTSQKEYTANGRTVYYVTYKDTYGLSFGNYIFPDSSASQTINGQTITAYSVAGYTTPALKEVADSVVIK